MNTAQSASRAEIHATGMEGEEAAARYLQKLGWTMLNRNWRCGPLELDIICRDGDTVAFVEVKTRADDGLASPADALTPTKRGRLVRAARAWLSAHDAWSLPCRFDLAAVTVHNGQYHTELIRHVIELGEGEERGRGKNRNFTGCGNSSWQPW